METFSPIQVVLDARQFQTDRERTSGSSAKEFFEGRDEAFVRHRESVKRQLSGVRARLQASSGNALGFVKVRMRDDALAKSHRPTQSLFPPNYAPLAGSAGVGEMIVQVSPKSLEHTLSQVQRAEDVLAYRPKKDKPNEMEPNPSRERSEVGAIESIDLWDAADRRSFSTDQAVDWFSQKGVPKAYRIDLFDVVVPVSKFVRQDIPSDVDLAADLMTAIDETLKCGYLGALYKPNPSAMTRLYLWLLPDSTQRSFVHAAQLRRMTAELGTPTLEGKNHQALLELLGGHAAVRRVSLPAALRPAASSSASRTPDRYTSPTRQVGADYPVIGVIDGGLGAVHSGWVAHHSQAVPETQASIEHGCAIAGLLVAGQAMNGQDICPEPDGCHLVDLSMVPDGTFFDTNYRSDLEFVLAIEQEVQAAKAAAGARVFCFSHNFQHPPASREDFYPDLSAGLDRIARDNDVIFVISAGNTVAGKGRKEWNGDTIRVLSDLASVSDDGITAPADSLFAVSVAALNPPSAGSHVSQAPARYSRRGLHSKHFVKPDVAHYGGVCGTTAVESGLRSVAEDSNHCSVFGTSYSGPLAAKTLARLDMLTGGRLPREALSALLLHGSRQPQCLRAYDKRVTRQLVGFGLPTQSEEFLAGSPHQATVLFYDSMQDKKDLFFDFSWPQSLVEAGKCRGEAMLTLVYSPPIVDSHDSELVRVNLQAVFHQRDKGSWVKRGKDAFATEPNPAASAMEKHLIDEGLKWGTVKQIKFRSPKGVGTSSEWRVCLKYLMRTSSERFPAEGIPFAAVLTIVDPDSAQPVYQDMKIGLGQRNIVTNDVRASVRQQVQARGR